MGGFVLALCQLIAILVFVGSLLTLGEIVGEDVEAWEHAYRGQRMMFCFAMMLAAVLLSVISGAAYELQRVRLAIEAAVRVNPSPIRDTRKS